MIKVDLITGLLGAGKTTFIKEYAEYIMSTGEKIGVLENDHGAINVDMLLLNDLRGENCELEMVAGGCDIDCHRRRFKTKLISMAMSGYDRVIIEPSGIFDVDEFLDSLRDEPLDNWYEIGNVFCVVDIYITQNFLNDQEEYLLGSQASDAGKIILSHIDVLDEKGLHNSKRQVKTVINNIFENIGCKRKLIDDDFICYRTNTFTNDDYVNLLSSGYVISDYIKKYSLEDLEFETIYYMGEQIFDKTNQEDIDAREADQIEMIKKKIVALFSDNSVGYIYRVKGYIKDWNCEGWLEINASSNSFAIRNTSVGQEVIIIIGTNLNKESIDMVMFEDT